MTVMVKGRLKARMTRDPADIDRARALRYRSFVDRHGSGRDGDRFDALCLHGLIEQDDREEPLACFRLRRFADGRALGDAYSARFFDLSALAAYDRPLLELGRFCTGPGRADPDVLRAAWALITRQVDECGAGMLFGCSSFAGTDPQPYRAAFALLQAHHRAPAALRPRQRADTVVRFPDLPDAGLRPAAAARQMPSLLRTYLLMGGWVSDHAAVDRELGTLLVFTGLEIDAVPAARARLLRADAA